MSRVGVVIIGRNEGERLKRCLRSVSGAGASVVYPTIADLRSEGMTVLLTTHNMAEALELAARGNTNV